MLTVVPMLSACASTQSTGTTEPLVEVVEGTRPRVTLSALSATPPTRLSLSPTSTPIPTLSSTRTAFVSPTPAAPTPSGTIGQATQPSTTPPNATATPTPTRASAATRTPIPTANLTLPPTLTPRSTTFTQAPATPQSSATPTPTPTATATVTSVCYPATQRTPASTAWSMSRVCMREFGMGNWEVYGELTNNTGGDKIVEDLVVTFFNAQSTPTVSDSLALLIDEWPNGAKAPFVGFVSSNTPPAQYSFDIADSPADQPIRRDLVILNKQMIPSGSHIIVTGQIQNPGADLAVYAEIVATFYDQNGAVVAYGYATIEADNIRSQQTAAFEITAAGIESAIRSFELLALGY